MIKAYDKVSIQNIPPGLVESNGVRNQNGCKKNLVSQYFTKCRNIIKNNTYSSHGPKIL